jgi:TolA-binding protein
MNSFEECINSGIDYVEESDLSNALAAFTKAIQNYANSEEEKALAYWNRSYVYAMKGEVVDTIYDLAEVLKNDPNHTNARKTLENLSKDFSLPSSARELAINKLMNG